MSVSISGYDVISKLGEGGMGAVFKAQHSLTGRKVAIKVLPPELAKDESFRRRFLREARAAAALNHPNITKVYDAGERGGLYYIIMEYVDGESIANIVKTTRPLKVEYALSVAREMAEGLAHAHAQGVIHRDIKPDNIMLNLERVTKITDMGLAKKLEAKDEGTDITLTGTVLGTPKYMSPEQILRPDAVDHRADIYSLGATLYFMLTGRAPFEGERAAQIMVKVCKEAPSYPRDLPRPVVRVLKALLAKERKKRPRSAEDVIGIIDDVLEALRSPASEHPGRERRPAYARPVGKSRKAITLGLLGTAAVVALVLIVMFAMGEKPGAIERTVRDRTEVPPPRPLLETPTKPPRASAALEKYEGVLEYAKNNPGDYPGVVEKLKAVLQEVTGDAALSDKIEAAIGEWTSRWEDAAKKEWEKTATAAGKLVADADYEGAAGLWKNFPETYQKIGTYGEQLEAEAAHLRMLEEVAAALKLLDSDFKAAEKEFTIDELEQAEYLLEKLSEFYGKYGGVELVAAKLKPVIASLKDSIGRLQNERWGREFFKTTAHLVRDYDFGAALELCDKALRETQLGPARSHIEREKRDIEALAGLCGLFRENLRQAAAGKKKIRLAFLDGRKLTGLVTAEGDALLINEEKTYVVELGTLHPESIVTLSGVDRSVPANQVTVALLYAYASFHAKARELFESAKEALSSEDVLSCSGKLAHLEEKYPAPGKAGPVAKTEPLLYEAQLWAEVSQDLRKAHRTEEAAQALFNAQKLTPSDKNLAAGAAGLFIYLHDHKHALALTKGALAKHKKDAQLLQLEALTLHFMKKYRDALRRIETAIKAAPKNKQAHLIHAGILNQLRRRKSARKAALTFFQLLDPGFKLVEMSDSEYDRQLEQAKQAVKSGQYLQATPAIIRLVAAHPEDARVYNLLGLILFNQGALAKAAEQFNAAMILNPKLPNPYANLGFIYARLGEPDAALATLEEGKKLTNIPAQLKTTIEQVTISAKQAVRQRDTAAGNSYNEGKQLYRQRKYREALEKFRPANTLKNSSGYFWMGHCYRGLGQPEQAIREFDKALLISPESGDNYYGKALVLKDRQRYEDAIESFKKCSELHKKKQGKDHYESWAGIADCYRRLGKTVEAAEAQRKAQGLRPNK